MDDARFEAEVIRRFAEPARFADAASFAVGLERRLQRGWFYRRAALAAAGGAGAVIAGAQILISGQQAAPGEIAEISSVGRSALTWVQDYGPPGLAEMPLGGEVLWLALGIVALAAALVIGRLQADE